MVTDAAAIEETPGLPSPRETVDLFGHEEIEKQLLQDFQSGRLPHALILAGPAGIGKETLAFRLARFLFQQDQAGDGGLFGDALPPETLYVGPEESVFKRVASGGHADLLTIDRDVDEKTGKQKTDVGVDNIRRIAPFLSKTAAEGGWRVVVVNSAETMKRSSQNAILKILEEPPAKTMLILVTSRPGTFLPTIRSRCRFVALEPLSEETVTQLLKTEAPDLSDDDLAAFARMSEGSIGRAISLYQEGGLELYQGLIGMLTDINLVQVHELADKLGRRGSENTYTTTMELLIWWLERFIRHQGQGAMPPEIVPGEEALYKQLTQRYSPKQMLQIWEDTRGLFFGQQNANLDRRQTVLAAFQNLQHAA